MSRQPAAYPFSQQQTQAFTPPTTTSTRAQQQPQASSFGAFQPASQLPRGGRATTAATTGQARPQTRQQTRPASAVPPSFGVAPRQSAFSQGPLPPSQYTPPAPAAQQSFSEVFQPESSMFGPADADNMKDYLWYGPADASAAAETTRPATASVPRMTASQRKTSRRKASQASVYSMNPSRQSYTALPASAASAAALPTPQTIGGFSASAETIQQPQQPTMRFGVRSSQPTFGGGFGEEEVDDYVYNPADFEDVSPSQNYLVSDEDEDLALGLQRSLEESTSPRSPDEALLPPPIPRTVFEDAELRDFLSSPLPPPPDTPSGPIPSSMYSAEDQRDIMASPLPPHLGAPEDVPFEMSPPFTPSLPRYESQSISGNVTDLQRIIEQQRRHLEFLRDEHDDEVNRLHDTIQTLNSRLREDDRVIADLESRLLKYL